MTRSKSAALAVFTTALLFTVARSSSSFAQDTRATTAPADAATTAPSTAPSDPGVSLKVKVAEVRGLVRVRNSPDEPWQKCTVGMEVGEGAEFQTGPKSVCVLTIENDQTIVLDRLGVVSVSEAVKKGDSVRTDLLMKYGRTEYEIEAAGAKHDATIRSPSSTLAVRGTRVNLYDQPPFVPSAESYTGRAIYQYANRKTSLGAPGRGAVVRSDRGSAAESALGETVVDPSIAEARTPSDAKLIETEVSRGALLSFDERTGINVIKGGSGPPSDENLASFLPGRFNVIARWTGDQDLNLVLDPDFFPADQILANIGNFANGGVDEILFPGFGQNITATGGKIDFDHRGGANGGFEVAYYDKPKTGIYGIIILPGGRGAREQANVKIQAFLDGESIDMVFPALDEQGNLLFDEEGFVVLDIGPVIERTVTSNETDVAGFTFVPSLSTLLGGGEGEGEPTEEAQQPQQRASNKATSERAARRAALQAEKKTQADEKKQQIAQQRDQRRLAREAARTQKVVAKQGVPDYPGQIGPRPLPAAKSR